MFFDLHADILYDIVSKRLNHKHNIIKDDHLETQLNGNMIGGIWCYYTDLDNPLPCDFDQAIDLILEEMEQTSDYVQVIKSMNDYNPNKLNVVLGLEGMVDVRDLDHFNQIYTLGFRHAMLTWNEENHFATGVGGNPEYGLTELGKEVISFMEHQQMIIDVSHANRKSFADILEHTTSPLLASHSNVFDLHAHRRNLTHPQIKQLIERDGLIGLTAVSHFLKSPNLEGLIHHINHYNQHELMNHVGFGFDFMYYLEGGKNLTDLITPLDSTTLIKKLESILTLDDIKKITHQNALNFLKKILK